MDRKVFLSLARKWHGEDEDSTEGMHSRADFFIVHDGEGHLFKQTHEIFTDQGDKRVIIKLPSLACGCTVDDPKDAISINGQLHCRICVKRCPSCGELIVPGTGEQIEQVWYHKPCAALPREHFEVKRALEEGFLVTKLQAAGRQVQLVEAQIDATRTNTSIQMERLGLEKKREDAQREMIAAQAHAVYRGLEFQERRIDLEERGVELQDLRFALEETQVRERIELEKQAAERQERTLESQLQSERLQRAISEGKFRLEWTERVKKLEQEGYLPKGTSQRLLP